MFMIEATAERTREYSAILQAPPPLSKPLAKNCNISMGAATNNSRRSEICKDELGSV
jgi:hypothetical protein